MRKKKKLLVLIGGVFLFSTVVLALGVKYYFFSKGVKMTAGTEKEFVNTEKISKVAPHTLYYDFEVAKGKEMPRGFYQGLAHSGQYCIKAFGENSFSVAVERTAGEVGVENLKAVALSAWVYVLPSKKEVKGNLVFTASNEAGESVCWKGIGVSGPEVPREKWFKISNYFDLSSIIFKPGYKIQAYFWNNSSTDILIDDVFISFGGVVDRRGDSARVDMTRPAGYAQKFNFPPFPVSFLEKEIETAGLGPADVGQEDLPVAGNFYNTGNDGLLVMKHDGSLAAYGYCPDSRKFKKLSLTNPDVCSAALPAKKMLKGKFLSTQGDQFVVVGEKGWMLCAIVPPEKICTDAAALQASIKVLGKPGLASLAVLAGDFNGDGRSEIIEVKKTGAWKVLAFEPAGNPSDPWKVIAQDDNQPGNDWEGSGREVSIFSGRFIPGLDYEVLLTVAKNKADGAFKYTLQKLNVPSKSWDPLFSKKQNFTGKTIGLDTLKPADEFYPVPGHGDRAGFFRYNRDWRFDMKEIRFTDSTFRIISAVDFHGYNRDQNPKYYESLKIVPGYFGDKASLSFLVFGHVSKSRHYQSILPDFVHIYSLPATK